MTSPLCPARPADPRPALTDAKTIRASVTYNAEALKDWSRKNGPAQNDDSWVIDAVTDALVEASGDASHALTLMELQHHWIADWNLRWHFDIVVKNLPGFLARALGEWVLRTATRFPGKVGDLIVFIEQDHHHSARIVKLYPIQAGAMVETEEGVRAFTHAENVIENKTNRNQAHRFIHRLLTTPVQVRTA